MSESSNTQPTDNSLDSLTLYTRSLHNYTLALWTESRRIAEEKARGREPFAVRKSSVQPSTSDERKEKIEAAQLTLSTSSADTDVTAPTNYLAGERQEGSSFSG
ncbi:hypothetical protein CVT25_008252 [Psilocybe cyanescens]|uniref:Uncharacterized protein n=1 Tax=Psilocybe cyanescens TaxID=93625 RepID=A0A409XJK2_PSICY|nr:hypothetical protein CVT25_008252 [Psilocybe cyanescens]